jgi:PKD repeat protein
LPFPAPLRRAGRRRSRGQSLVEFALVVPFLLLLTMTAIDFGRVFLGWVNLQQMTRIAANFAADHASAWGTPGNATDKSRYQIMVDNDARAINCNPPGTIAPPQFTGGTALGAHVRVAIDCQFHVITPIISSILGGTILVSAETTYPIKEGAVATVPGGGSPIVTPPTADFVGSPQSGWSPLIVTFTDLSTGGPAGWSWDFSAGTPGGTGASAPPNPTTRVTQGPQTVTYTCSGAEGSTCIYGVSLNVSNAGGADSETKTGYITVTVPPTTGPIAEFTGTPRSGTKPLTVNFQFVDLRGGAVTYTTYEWDFDGNGSGGWDATGQTTSHTYTADGAYTVTLQVTDSTGATNRLTKTGYINVFKKICTVPDFANVKKNNAQSVWGAAGFTTTVTVASGQGNYTIHSQSIVGGTIDPQPDGCDSTITVGP